MPDQVGHDGEFFLQNHPHFDGLFCEEFGRSPAESYFCRQSIDNEKKTEAV